MPRKKAEPITRVFFLDSPRGAVEIIVKAPAGAVRLQSTHDSLSITTGSAVATAAGVRAAAATQIEPTVRPAGASVQPETNFVSSSKLSEADLLKEDAELRALKESGASLEEINKALEARNGGGGPKPRATRQQEIAKRASSLRTISVETEEGHVEATIGMSGATSN